MYKRNMLLTLAFITVLALALTACGGDAPATTAPSNEVEAAEPVVEPAELEEPEAEPAEEVVEPAVEEDAPSSQFEIFNPYEALSEEDILYLEADGFTGTDQEIADAILAWQGEHMHYIGNPFEQPDISHPMRWNNMLPGIFPVSDMIHERVMEDGHIYGLCWDYAAIFNAIANYYGLEVRVTANKVYMSEVDPNIDPSTANGMGPDEYEALRPRLEAAGLDLSYDQIDRAAHETWGHYRAEVRINGEWVGYDGAPGVSSGLTYEVAPWDEGYDADLLYASVEGGSPQADDTGLAALADALEDAPAADYEGMTDDNGDAHRAANMDDLMTGLGLVPYLTDPEDVLAFLQAGEMMEDFSEYAGLIALYEAGTGKPFYVIADVIIYTSNTMSAEEYVPLYNALTGSDMTFEEFEMYVQ